VKEFQLAHVPNFEELGFKVGPSFIVFKDLFSTLLHDGSFARSETSVSNWSWKTDGFNHKKTG
jgi:hypothetical protein